ncbi:UDP-glucose 4-epimerase [Pseudomonas fluorescens]|nr:UDP-glucose 4-epimerase [Pseudomonas fluorescens]
MKILVTGGAGYVGSVLVPALLKKKHQVTVLDSFLFCSKSDLPVHSKLRLVKGDIRDKNLVCATLRNMDAVIHLAAISNDPSGDLDHALTKVINHDSTCTLVDAAAAAKIKRFINASSASVYGVSHELRVVETLSLNPQTIYAETKATSEAYVLMLNSSDFVTVSVRPATLHGYAKRLRLDLTANIFTSQAIANQEIRVFGGAQYRPSLSVLDMVQFYLELLEAPSTLVGGRTFNVVESNNTICEIAEIVRDAVDPNVSLIFVESQDQRSYTLNADLAKDILNFRPHYRLAESISHLAGILRSWDSVRIGSARFRNVEWLKKSPELLRFTK